MLYRVHLANKSNYHTITTMMDPIIVTNLEIFYRMKYGKQYQLLYTQLIGISFKKCSIPFCFDRVCIILFSPQLSANCNTEFHIKPLILRDIIKNPFTQFLYFLYTVTLHKVVMIINSSGICNESDYRLQTPISPHIYLITVVYIINKT